MSAKGGQVRSRGACNLFAIPGSWERQGTSDCHFPYSILYLLSVAAEGTSKGGVWSSENGLIAQGCLTESAAVLKMSSRVATRDMWLLRTWYGSE